MAVVPQTSSVNMKALLYLSIHVPRNYKGIEEIWLLYTLTIKDNVMGFVFEVISHETEGCYVHYKAPAVVCYE